MKEIHFVLPRLLPTRNQQDRMHFHKKRELKESLALEVRHAVREMPAQPLKIVSVTVWRHSLVEPDSDGLSGSLKQLLDVLQPQGKLVKSKGKLQLQNPQGLGIILSDKPSCCLAFARWIKARHRTEQKTVVVIKELSEIPKAHAEAEAA